MAASSNVTSDQQSACRGRSFHELLEALREEHERSLGILQGQIDSRRVDDDELGATQSLQQPEASKSVELYDAKKKLIVNIDAPLPDWSVVYRRDLSMKDEENGSNSMMLNMKIGDKESIVRLWPEWHHDSDAEMKPPTESRKTRNLYAEIDRCKHAMSKRTRSSQAQADEIVQGIPLNPNSQFRICWDLIGIVALFYDLYTIPLQVFDIENEKTFIVCGWIVLVYWTFDIAMSFLTGYIDRSGAVVRNMKLIIERYMASWLIPDLLVVGLEWSVVFLETYLAIGNAASYARMSKFMRIARIIRTLRMTRLAKLKDIIYAFQYRINSEWMAIVYSLACNVFVLITLNHFTACGWYLLGKSIEGETWVKHHKMVDVSPATKYLSSLHWSLTVFTPGSIDVHPQNNPERAYAIVNLILAMVVFASFVSSVTAGMTRLRNIDAENTRHDYLLRKFLRENNISIGLSGRITRYIDIARSKHRKKTGRDSVHLLSWLSGPLNIELRKELCWPYLWKHEFFIMYEGTNHSATNELCLAAALTHAISKGDVVFSRFSNAKHMYFVMTGSFVYRRSTEMVCSKQYPRHTRISSSGYFSEPALWVNWMHQGTVKAITESDCMSIDSAKLREVSLAHHDVLTMACEYALAFYLKMVATYESQGSVWDLTLGDIASREPSGLTESDHEERFITAAERVEAHLIDWSDSEDSGEEIWDAKKTLSGQGTANFQSEATVGTTLSLSLDAPVDDRASK